MSEKRTLALFCNKCRKRIIPPKFLLSGNLNVQSAITIKCGDPKCKGHIKYKPKKEEETE